MTDHEKRKKIKAYFAPFPQWAAGVMAGAILVMVWQGPLFAYGLGWAAIAMSGWALKEWAVKPTDAEMDRWLEEDRKSLMDRSLTKCSLVPTELVRDSVVVTSPRLRNFGGAFLGVRRGLDKQVRYAPAHVTLIHFTEHQLVLYQCALDLSTGNPLNESVDEFFYKDVVGVATRSQSMTFLKGSLDQKLIKSWPGLEAAMVDDKLQLNSAETFVLTTSAGLSAEVVLRDPVLIQNMGDATMPTELADQAVQAVRSMLRVKKQAS